MTIAAWIATVFLFTSGFAFLILGLFAYYVGIDHNAAWETGRIVMVVAGVVFILCSLVLHFSPCVRVAWKCPSFG